MQERSSDMRDKTEASPRNATRELPRSGTEAPPNGKLKNTIHCDADAMCE